MADIDQLHKALINADAAGDTEAATALAAEIKRAGVSQLQAKADAWSKGNTGVIDNLTAIPKGLYKGLTDTSGGITQAIAHGAAKVFPSLSDSVKEYDQTLANREKEFQAQSAETPIASNASRIAGNFISTLPATSLKVAKGAGAIPKLVNGLLQGGAIGGTQAVTEGDYSDQKLKQIGIGSAAGGAGTILGGVLARMVKPNTSPEVQALLRSGVTPTPGQILGGAFAKTEEKLSGLPILGDAIKYGQRNAVNDLNRVMYNRALNPIGEKSTSDVGRLGVSEVSRKLSAKYDDLLPKLKFQGDQEFGQELTNLLNMAKQLPPEKAQRFEQIIRNQLIGKMTPQGAMLGDVYKGVESELSAAVKGYRSSSSYDERKLGDAVNEVLSSLRKNLARSNPDHAAELADINKGYAGYDRIRDASSRLGAKEGIFTAEQLQGAVRAGDKSVKKGDFARGRAFGQDLSDPAVTVLGSKYPDSGTAGRALTMSLLYGGLPLAGGLAAAPASVMYAPGVRDLVATLLAKRPDIAEPISNAIRGGAPALGASLAPFLVGSKPGN